MAIAHESREAGSALDVQDAVSGGRHTLVLSGELDMESVPRLQRLVVHLCADGAREIAMDLSKLRFMDSTGLHAILAAQIVCRDHGTGFMLTPPRGAVRRVFELTGMMDALPFEA
jgi:anti-sigma B factor antagonist